MWGHAKSYARTPAGGWQSPCFFTTPQPDLIEHGYLVATSLHVRDLDIVDVDSARSTIKEHEPSIRVRTGEIGIDRTDRAAVDPHLRMPIAYLIVLHLDAVPGIRAQGVVRAEYTVDSHYYSRSRYRAHAGCSQSQPQRHCCRCRCDQQQVQSHRLHCSRTGRRNGYRSVLLDQMAGPC